jgi:hypothetical protein
MPISQNRFKMDIARVEIMALLPECSWRKPTETVDIYYCRHSQMHTHHDLVTPGHCRVCVWRLEPCANPRPENYDPQTSTSPSLTQKIWNLGESITAFVADGFSTVTREQYEERLAICNTCEQRDGSTCRLCGCFLTLKAQGRAFECPLGKWPKAISGS